MACFLVPTAEAVVVTAAAQVVKQRELRQAAARPAEEEGSAAERVPFSRKLKWLCTLLWGGALLLAFEHLWHGEIVPYFPFLSAMSDPADTAVMLHEMATVGVCMALLITAVWAVMCVAADLIVKRSGRTASKETA